MRKVEIVVPDECRNDAFDVLDEVGVDFVVHGRDRRDASLVSFPLPSGAVEDVLNRLRDVGVDVERYTVVSDLDAAFTPNFDELEKSYTEGSEAESRIARGELRTSAREIEPDRTVFSVQAVLSATVAAAGLLLNSAIAIVGAMVISPFTSAFLTAALGVIIDDRNLSKDGGTGQLLGLSLAVVTGVAIGLLAHSTTLVPPAGSIGGMKQMSNFSSPGPLLLTIAVTAGGASALAMASNQGVVLAGVAVAAAVVPSAATLGIGLAWGQFAVARGALVVLLMNVGCINLVSYLTFLALGYNSSTVNYGR